MNYRKKPIVIEAKQLTNESFFDILEVKFLHSVAKVKTQGSGKEMRLTGKENNWC